MKNKVFWLLFLCAAPASAQTLDETLFRTNPVWAACEQAYRSGDAAGRDACEAKKKTLASQGSLRQCKVNEMPDPKVNRPCGRTY